MSLKSKGKKKKLPRLCLYEYPFKGLSMSEKKFLKFAESMHYKYISDDDLDYVIREQFKYLLYTEFIPNGKSQIIYFISDHRIYERRLLERIQVILYYELYTQLYDTCHISYFSHLFNTFRKEFVKRATFSVDFDEMRENATNEMKNDLNKIVAENSISRKYLIECLIEYGLFGDDIANIIADFLSAQYPFLCQPPPNPYYYNNLAFESHFGRLDQASEATSKFLQWPRKDIQSGRIQIVEGNRSLHTRTADNLLKYLKNQLYHGFVSNEYLNLFHFSKSQKYEMIHRVYFPGQSSDITCKMVGSCRLKDGELWYCYGEVPNCYSLRPPAINIWFSKSWTDLWNFIRNDAIKIDCYSGLYFANTDAM